jgi:2-iminobutanoate/2-iminopropanoate deaminase
MPTVKTSTPLGTPTPIGPYSHIAQVGSSITIGGTTGVDPSTGQFTGDGIGAQTRQLLDNFAVMLASVDSDLAHVVHINIYLTNIDDFDAMNLAYVNRMGDHRPARTVVGVQALPKAGALLSMNLTAVTRD